MRIAKPLGTSTNHGLQSRNNDHAEKNVIKPINTLIKKTKGRGSVETPPVNMASIHCASRTVVSCRRSISDSSKVSERSIEYAEMKIESPKLTTIARHQIFRSLSLEKIRIKDIVQNTNSGMKSEGALSTQLADSSEATKGPNTPIRNKFETHTSLDEYHFALVESDFEMGAG